MELLTRVNEVCRAHGTTVAKVERAVGFNKTIYNWNKYSPSIDKVAAVADYFGISVDELIGREVPALSAADRQILELIHQLNEEGQTAAIKQLQFLSLQPEYIKSHHTEEVEEA